MPVEILELNVRASVREGADHTSQGQPSNGASGPESNSSSDSQAIIQECVAQVMEILRHNQER
jgi:uncharacterized protein DUF5908